MALGFDKVALMSISLATAMMGIVAYHRAPDRVWNRLFTVHALAVSAWVFLNYLIQIANTPAEAELWIRLTHPIVAVVICTCVDLFWTFPERVEFAPELRRNMLYSIGLMFSTAGLLPMLLTSVRFAHGTVIVEYGWPFMAFGVFTVVTLGYADVVLILKFPRLTGLQRVQVTYVLVGMVISQAIAVVTMVLLPLLWHNTYWSRWGSAGYIFMVGFMAYAIAKHRIIRPKAALYRGLAYVLTGVGVALLLLSFFRVVQPALSRAHVSAALTYMLAGIVLGVLAVPVHQQIKQLLDRSLPYGRVAAGVRYASDAILRTLDVDEIPGFLSDAVSSILRPSHVSVFLKENHWLRLAFSSRHGNSNSRGTDVSEQRLALDSTLVQAASSKRSLLDRSQVLRFHSLDEAKPILGAMREHDVEIVVPILWEDELIGLVLIGEKVSSEMYAPEELEMLRNMMPQVSLAIRNAQLFDEMVRLKEYNENIVRQMKSGVISVDGDQRIVLFNPAAEEMLGLSAHEMMGQTLAALPHNIARCVRQALGDTSARSEYRFHVERPGRTPIPVACSTTGWPGSQLSQTGAVAVISDLTIVEELERERQQAEHLAMIRVLSAGMAHEIRNPLVAVRTFAELLPTRWEDAEFRGKFLATAEEEIERIDRLLADLLMLSKPADAVCENIDVDAVCDSVVRAMSARAEARGVKLVTDLQVNGQQPMGDEGRLHQALLNLVSNAVEAEPESGLVKLTTRQGVGNQDSPIVIMSVYNASSHIPESQREQIFKPFYSRRAGGTGLGLAICQTIIEEHGGAIRVKSDIGEGTEFLIELPLPAGNGEDDYARSSG